MSRLCVFVTYEWTAKVARHQRQISQHVRNASKHTAHVAGPKSGAKDYPALVGSIPWGCGYATIR